MHDRVGETQRADLLMVDCWTGETAAHVVAARDREIALGSLADLVLHEARAPVIGVTGTAGKTMTARLIGSLLREQGWSVEIPPTGRADNAWPSADSLSALERGDAVDAIVVELTSTHLAYMTTSPRHAVITALWPDHVELHGGEGRYIAAKQRILSRQPEGASAVLPAGETRVAAKPGVRTLRFSGTEAVPGGVGIRHGDVIDDLDGEGAVVASVTVLPHLCGNVAAAVATVRGALGVAGDLQPALDDFRAPPWRGECIGFADTCAVVHNGMAATPAKGSAYLHALPDQSAVVIMGGLAVSSGGQVHASAAETRMLREACGEVARVARTVVLIGPAAASVAPLLAEVGAADVRVGPDLHWGTGEALGEARKAECVAWVPMFPVELADRERFAELAQSAARAAGARWIAPSLAFPAKDQV